MKAIFELIRPLTSLMAGLAVLISALVAVGLNITSYFINIVLAFFVVFLFTASGNALNDYFDIEIDKISHPERPLPSGKITRSNALIFSIVTFGIAIFISLFINSICFFIAVFALVLQLCYEKFFKKKGIFGNITISFLTALAFFFGGAAVNHADVTIVLGLLAFFSILGREIIKDIEDMKGDIDRINLPKVIGKKNASILASLLLIFAILLSPLPYYPMKIFDKIYIPIVVVADIVIASSIYVQFKNPYRARRIIKFGMLIALIAFLIGGITGGIGS
ncbi:MAG: UbiA family prenyltransferase [Methanomicrobia archaeon]|nr:UbiA family prenyltransferase [Methanomicrobia archaeon]